MAKDPNKIYIQDSEGNTSEAKKVDRDAAYKASRERFLAQRENYKNTPMPAQTAKEAAVAAKRQGTQAGHYVTNNDNHTRPIK